MTSWFKTLDGWAANLDGASAAEFALPRLELHSSPQGWTCVCHRQNGTSLELELGEAESTAAAKRAAAEEALLVLGTQYGLALRALMGDVIA